MSVTKEQLQAMQLEVQSIQADATQTKQDLAKALRELADQTDEFKDAVGIGLASHQHKLDEVIHGARGEFQRIQGEMHGIQTAVQRALDEVEDKLKTITIF